MPEYTVAPHPIDSHDSEATAKDARIVLDTGMAGGADAFKPAEMPADQEPEELAPGARPETAG